MTKPRDMVMAAGVAFAAALFGLAPAARADEPDPFQLLFGDSGINNLDLHGGRLFGHQRSDPGRRLRRERH